MKPNLKPMSGFFGYIECYFRILKVLINCSQILTEEQHDMANKNQYDFDHPDAFDFDLIYQTLEQLKKGKQVNIPIYNFTTHSRELNQQRIYGANVVIFEGKQTTFLYNTGFSVHVIYLSHYRNNGVRNQRTVRFNGHQNIRRHRCGHTIGSSLEKRYRRTRSFN